MEKRTSKTSAADGRLSTGSRDKFPFVDPSNLPFFLDSLDSKNRVQGSTHTFYRYPARFSPEFARQAIRTFSREGDVVLDPFMGGGTTAVEALGEGRRFIGNDVSRLACYVSGVKTTLLSISEEAEAIDWAARLDARIDLSRPEKIDPVWTGYQKNLPWHLRRLFAHALNEIESLSTARLRNFSRCTLLNAAQWALDCKSSIPASKDVLDRHLTSVSQMLHGLQEFQSRIRSATGRNHLTRNSKRLICGDAARIDTNAIVNKFGTPRLILTSPPYLGVHVLYHRWQILGRRETPAPFWIANQADGHSSVFYTFAERRAATADRYLHQLKACFGSLRRTMDEKTALVTLVAFHDPDIQLPLYLRALESIGLEQCDIQEAVAKPATRQVPNRKWYANLEAQSRSSTEFLIVCRRTKKRSRQK
jgi:hypothetical protein